MFADSSVTLHLKKLKASIRMGMMDLTPERAAVIRHLNRSGIPVTAWLLLPEEKGYWFHIGNGPDAIARYIEVRDWAKLNGLEFRYIGLDMELDMKDVQLFKTDPWKMALKLIGRLYDDKPLVTARRHYDSLLGLIRSDGFNSESYYASFVKDEVDMGNTAIQQSTGFMDIKTDREIPMLYSSFMGNADGLITVYGRDAGVRTVALGSTGGGVDTGLPTLSYENLVHDIRLASSFATEIHIFSLEGCVMNGFLERLTSEDLSSVATIEQEQVESVRKIQSLFRTSSTLLSYPTWFFLAVILVTLGLLAVLVWGILSLTRKLRTGTKRTDETGA